MSKNSGSEHAVYLMEPIHPAFQIFDGTVQLDFKAINSAVQHLHVGMGVGFFHLEVV